MILLSHSSNTVLVLIIWIGTLNKQKMNCNKKLFFTKKLYQCDFSSAFRLSSIAFSITFNCVSFLNNKYFRQ